MNAFPSFLFFYWFPATLLLIAIARSVVPFSVIISRKPVVYSDRWPKIISATMIILLSLHGLLYMISKKMPAAHWYWLAYAAFAFGAVLELVIRRKGYIIKGASKSYFYQALHAASQSAGFTVQEWLPALRISAQDQEIAVAMPKEFGEGVLDALKIKANRPTERLVQELRKYFRENTGEKNLQFLYFDFFFAFGFLAIAIALFVFVSSLRQSPF